MQSKKSHKANLERKRGVHFITGIVVSLSLILISFEWTRPVDLKKDLAESVEIDFVDVMIRVEREEVLPKKKQVLPALMEVILLTDEDVPDIEIPDWEVTDKTRIDIYGPVIEEPEVILEQDPFIIVEDMPLFNGEDASKSFLKFIMQNLKYPAEAAEMAVSGRVYVRFVIDKTGRLTTAEIFRGVHPVLDAEALRVVKLSPVWTPGRQRGKAVPVQFIFPINFVLQ